VKLPKQAIDEFKEIYKDIMKIDLTDEEAEFYANEMMKLMLLAQPLPTSKINDILIEEKYKNTSTSNGNRTNKTSNRQSNPKSRKKNMKI